MDITFKNFDLLTDRKLVIVKWRDIVATAGWQPSDEVDCPIIESVGWLIEHEDITTIKICNTISEDIEEGSGNEREYGITAFPRGCVISLEFLSHEVSNELE